MRFDIRLMEERTAGRLEGRREGLAEGRREGLAEGRRETRNRIRLLVAALEDTGRLDELPEVIMNDDIYQRLLNELGIVSEDEYVLEG